MKIYPPFPTCREATPTRRAEKLIYEALEASELDGLALYEVKPLSSAPQLDFAVWLLDIGTFGIQGKGGRYIIIDGEWYLITDRGRIRKESPIPGTWDAAMAIHDWVQEQLRHKIFVIPVLGPAAGQQIGLAPVPRIGQADPRTFGNPRCCQVRFICSSRAHGCWPLGSATQVARLWRESLIPSETGWTFRQGGAQGFPEQTGVHPRLERVNRTN